jgi:hypothetical protein
MNKDHHSNAFKEYYNRYLREFDKAEVMHFYEVNTRPSPYGCSSGRRWQNISTIR